MFELEDDGITHINIYSKGKTEIGRWLSNFSHVPIIIPEHGNFSSIEAYWYWLGTRNERLRTLYGYTAKKFGKSLEIKQIDGFEDYIKNAIDIKLKSDRRKMLELRLTNLPLTHYYVFGSVKKDAGFEWIIEHIENRRKLLKQWNPKISAE